MYYPLYNNPFYYPSGAYMNNMCSYGYASNIYNQTTSNETTAKNPQEPFDRTSSAFSKGETSTDFFSINQDRVEVFGISINIDDLIIIIMLFFMFRESQIDYSIIIILALILFDQN